MQDKLFQPTADPFTVIKVVLKLVHQDNLPASCIAVLQRSQIVYMYVFFLVTSQQ